MGALGRKAGAIVCRRIVSFLDGAVDSMLYADLGATRINVVRRIAARHLAERCYPTAFPRRE
jgi:hypothetical protein